MRGYTHDVFDLTMTVKLGDKWARQELLKMNITLINRIAYTTFNEINKLYKEKFEIDLPDNIISDEDVIQDFYIKSLNLLDNYINKDVNLYFSVYLNNMLAAYSKSYVKMTSLSLFKIYDNESERNLDNQFQRILDVKQDEFIKDEMLKLCDLDSYMSYYKDIINIVFKYSNFQAIEEETGFNKRYVTRRLTQFAELYKTRREILLNIERTEQILKLINNFDDEYFKKLCSYLNDVIMKDVLDIYYQINSLDESIASNISIDDIKNKILLYIYDCILKYKNNTYSGVDNFMDFLYKKLRSYKRGYINKFKSLLKKRKINNNLLKRKKLK